MGIQFLTGDIFYSKAQTIAHGCNCRGRMGAGIALEIKRRYPRMFKEYRRRCHKGLFAPGGYFLHKESTPWILNLATQGTIDGAEAGHVERCFRELPQYYGQEGITSLAVPRIAAGLGGLEWQDVRRLICEILGPMTIPIFVYEDYQRGSRADETA